LIYDAYMTLKVDQKTDALYLRLDDSRIVDSEQVSPDVILDYNDKDHVVGIEILHFSERSRTLT